jgi:hypothetical protein
VRATAGLLDTLYHAIILLSLVLALIRWSDGDYGMSAVFVMVAWIHIRLLRHM